MRWAGHRACMGVISNMYKILIGKPKWKRPGGRCGCRWERFSWSCIAVAYHWTINHRVKSDHWMQMAAIQHCGTRRMSSQSQYHGFLTRKWSFPMIVSTPIQPVSQHNNSSFTANGLPTHHTAQTLHFAISTFVDTKEAFWKKTFVTWQWGALVGANTEISFPCYGNISSNCMEKCRVCQLTVVMFDIYVGNNKYKRKTSSNVTYWITRVIFTHHLYPMLEW
jgi:hypothetical protein